MAVTLKSIRFFRNESTFSRLLDVVRRISSMCCYARYSPCSRIDLCVGAVLALRERKVYFLRKPILSLCLKQVDRRFECWVFVQRHTGLHEACFSRWIFFRKSWAALVSFFDVSIRQGSNFWVRTLDFWTLLLNCLKIEESSVSEQLGWVFPVRRVLFFGRLERIW